MDNKKDEKLICPVRRLESSSINLEIKEDKDDLINVKADIKIKNPITAFINFINKQFR